MDKSIKKKYLFYFLMGIAFSLFCQSAAGQTNTRYGLGWNVAQLRINDPERLGESGFTTRGDLTYFSGMMTIPIDNHNPLLRLWYELKYRTFTLEPSTVKIGQYVKSLSLSVTAQTLWSAPGIGNYWAGVGLGMSADDFSHRTVVDQDGFLAQSFNDRKEMNIGMILNTGVNLRKTRRGHFIGLNVSSHASLTKGINGLSAMVFVQW